MSFSNWRDAVASLEALTNQKQTSAQSALAKFAGIKIPANLPRLVAAARLRDALAEQLGLPGPRDAVPGRIEFLKGLARAVRKRLPIAERQGEVDAWYLHLRLVQRQAILTKLKLEAGDIVRRRGDPRDAVDEVSSIGFDGSVHLKGGSMRAWPDDLVVVVRRAVKTRSANDLRTLARNRAADRARLGSWSKGKQALLEPFETRHQLEQADLDRLRIELGEARDESPLQHYFQTSPHVLTSLLVGDPRFCLPQPKLSTAFVPDFLMSDVDSTGIRWVLVELESPDSPVALTEGNDFEQRTRKGLSQIREWRQWLEDNLDHARRAKSDGGLGLVDITPRCDGLLVVGRRELLRPSASKLRKQLWESERIKVQTYDGLIQQLERTLAFRGPPAANPDLIGRL